MGKRNFCTLIACLLIVGSCFLTFKEHVTKILYHDNHYLACTDFGQYFIEVKDYLQENKNYMDLIKVTEDPGFFIIASNLGRITNIPSTNLLTIFSMLMYCFVGFCVLVLSRQQSSKNKSLTGLLGVFLYISLYATTGSFISGIWRQIMGDIFFLVFLISRKYPSSMGYMIVGILSGTMFILTHRIFIMLGFPVLIFILVRSMIYAGKPNKRNIYLCIIIFLLGLPYIALFSEYALHVFEYRHGLELAGTPSRGYFQLTEGTKDLGWSFFGPRDDRTAIMHYLFYQSYILIAAIAFLKKFFKKANKDYVFAFLFVFVYVSGKLDFSVRVLLTFEIMILPVLAFNLIFNYSKQLRIVFVISIFLLGFLSSTNGLRRLPVKEFDAGIYFLFNNVNQNEKNYLLSSTCGSDLMGQLGFTNYFNFQMQLHGVREKKKNNIPDVYELESLTQQNIVFLKREGTMFDFFKDKGKIFIIIISTDKQEVELLKNGKSDLLGKDYLKLVYPSTFLKPGTGIISYIFEVDVSKINFTDTKQYIQTNIEDLNLKVDF